MKRNFTRWACQYEASKTSDIESMDKLMKWLGENMPTNEQCTVVHGDFRLVLTYFISLERNKRFNTG